MEAKDIMALAASSVRNEQKQLADRITDIQVLKDRLAVLEGQDKATEKKVTKKGGAK